MKYTVITHSGSAHRDEFLACCVLLAHGVNVDFVVRRDPTPEELNDPNVWVVDVGGQYDPSKLNFDHHQMDRNAPPVCALTLVLEHLGLLADARDTFLWLKATEELDSKGPFQWAKNNNLQWETVAPLAASPIEGAILKWFSESDRIGVCGPGFLWRVMYDIGKGLVEQIRQFTKRITELDTSVKVTAIRGVAVVDASAIDRTQNPVFGLEAWCKKNHPEAGVTITQDDRGDGLCLFRRNDNPRVDFAKCKEKEGVVFAHNSGFVLKTKPEADVGALLSISID